MIDLTVVSYNNIQHLPRLFDTLYSDYEEGVFNLNVVDNKSTDGSWEWLNNRWHSKHPGWYSVFTSPSNIGYARACCAGTSMSTNPYLGFLNADVWLTTKDVRAIVEMFERTDFDIIGPKQRDEQGRIRHAGIVGTNERPRLRGWGEYDPGDNLYLDTCEVVSVAGSAYFIRRSVWDDLTACPIYREVAPDAKGAFLPTQMYYEETFCSYHARAHGYKVVYTGLVSIGHSWAGSTGGDNTSLAPISAESRAYFRSACAAHDIRCD